MNGNLADVRQARLAVPTRVHLAHPHSKDPLFQNFASSQRLQSPRPAHVLTDYFPCGAALASTNLFGLLVIIISIFFPLARWSASAVIH